MAEFECKSFNGTRLDFTSITPDPHAHTILLLSDGFIINQLPLGRHWAEQRIKKNEQVACVKFSPVSKSQTAGLGRFLNKANSTLTFEG